MGRQNQKMGERGEGVEGQERERRRQRRRGIVNNHKTNATHIFVKGREKQLNKTKQTLEMW